MRKYKCDSKGKVIIDFELRSVCYTWYQIVFLWYYQINSYFKNNVNDNKKILIFKLKINKSTQI